MPFNKGTGMGAGLAIVALIGGAVSVAIVGYHGVFATFVTASVGASMTTLLVAFITDALHDRGARQPASEPLLAPAPAKVESAGPT